MCERSRNMSKRILSLVLALMLIFALCACGSKNKAEDTADAEETTVLPPASYEKEDGKLYREVYYNSNGLKYSTIIHEYDGYGRVASEIELGENDAPVSKCTYEYNDDGLKTAKLGYVAEGPEEYTFAYKVDYEYDENGNLVREQRTENDVIAAVTVYTYNDKNVLVKEEQYEGEEFMLCAYEYVLDENGNVEKCIRHDYLEGIDSENRYTYDSNGNVIADVSYDADGNIQNRIEYNYDENGNEVKRSVFDSNGGMQSSTSNEYSYDEYGNIEKVVSTHSDGSQGTTVQYTWQYSKG